MVLCQSELNTERTPKTGRTKFSNQRSILGSSRQVTVINRALRVYNFTRGTECLAALYVFFGFRSVLFARCSIHFSFQARLFEARLSNDKAMLVRDSSRKC